VSTLLLAVVGASLLGSLHCAGMCGAFAAIAMAPAKGRAEGATRSEGRVALQGAYHGGRLVGYTALGAAGGMAGALLDLGGVLAGLSSAAAILAGVTLIGFGALELVRQLGAHTGRFGALPRPAFLNRLVARAVRTNRPFARAVAMGAASALLPCGWLYAFVVTAAGTGGALGGGLVMAAFWVGTVPILATLGLSAEGLRRILGSRLPIVASAAVLLLGIATLVGRVELDAAALAARVDAVSHGAGQGAGAPFVPDAEATPPCCCEEPAR
jgi:sulfite exporter TauE/SafE